MSKLSRFLIVVIVALGVVGCSTNSLVIRYFYGRMDNNLNSRILAMADFSDAQKEEIRKAVDDYAAWHRRNELPRYAEFIEELTLKVELGVLNHDVVLQDMETIRNFAKTGFLKSPFVQSTTFLKSLEDRQVAQVAEHFSRQDEEFLEWMEKRKSERGSEKRLNSIVKNTRRFGIKLNDEQQRIISQGLTQYDNDPMERHLLWSRWEQQLIEILEDRKRPEFEVKLTEHLRIYQDQMRIHNPQRDLHNRRVSAQMILDVVQNLDPQQKQTLLSQLEQTKKILLRISSS